MPELIDAFIGIGLVGYVWLAALGKVNLSKDPVKNGRIVEKLAPVKVLAPIAIIAFVLLALTRLAR